MPHISQDFYCPAPCPAKLEYAEHISEDESWSTSVEMPEFNRRARLHAIQRGWPADELPNVEPLIDPRSLGSAYTLPMLVCPYHVWECAGYADRNPHPMPTMLKVGERVFHDELGAGTVIRVPASLNDRAAEIYFDKEGSRFLRLPFNRLFHLESLPMLGPWP